MKFGCEVKIEEDKYLVISKQLDEKVFCLYENESYTRFFGEDQFEILGRKNKVGIIKTNKR